MSQYSKYCSGFSAEQAGLTFAASADNERPASLLQDEPRKTDAEHVRTKAAVDRQVLCHPGLGGLKQTLEGKSVQQEAGVAVDDDLHGEKKEIKLKTPILTV